MCRRTGGSSEEGTPVPIPNTVVKLFCSDDTLGAAPRENRSSPFHPPIRAVFVFPEKCSEKAQTASPFVPFRYIFLEIVREGGMPAGGVEQLTTPYLAGRIPIAHAQTLVSS